MYPLLKFEHDLYTYQHDSFFKVELSCEHAYYGEGKCADLVLELSTRSKRLLKERGFFFKEQGHSLLIGRKKSLKSGDKALNSVLPEAFPDIIVQLKVINPRFWLVTDFAALKKGQEALNAKKPLLYRNTGTSFMAEIPTLDFIQELQEQHNNRKEFSRAIFAIVCLDVRKLDLKTEFLPIKFKAASVKLRYKVESKKKSNKNLTSTKKLRIEDVLGQLRELTECPIEQEKPLTLSVEHRKEENIYILESQKEWEMRQENKHENSNFFKFEVVVDDSKRAKEGKAEVFLPFPNRIHQSLFKKEGKTKIIEQTVNLLRFAAKASPSK